MDPIIKMVLDSNWTDLTKYTERKAAYKISEKINQKKAEIIARLNDGYDDVDDEQ